MVIVYAAASGEGGANIMGMSIVPSYVINNRWNNLDNETCMLIPCSDDSRTSMKYKASNREISIQAKGSTSWFVDIFAR